MKHWQKRRGLAMLLLVATILTATIPFTVSAEESTTSSTESNAAEDLYGGRTLDEILNLIGGTSYNRYSATHSDKGVASVTRKDPLVFTSENIVLPGDADFIDDKTGEDRTTAEIVIKNNENASQFDGIDPITDKNGNEIAPVYTPGNGKVTYKVVITEAGMYSMDLYYFPVSTFNGQNVGTKTTIERMCMIDGELPFSECRYLYIPRCWEYVGTDGTSELYREGQPKRDDYQTQEAYDKAYDEWLATGAAGNFVWDKDIENNDIRPDRVEAPEWRTYFLRDWLGYTVEPFQFYLSEGTHYITFEATREPLVIGELLLYGYSTETIYEQQLEKWNDDGLEPVKGNAIYMIEAESPDRVSDQVLFPGTDRTSCLNSPSSPADLLYNISNSSVVGQYMRYNVYVSEEGLYNIMVRFRQNTMAGMFTSRRIRINGEIPFAEASYLRFNYDTRFQNQLLGYENEDGDWEPYYFYFEEGWNTVELEVVLGDMSDYIYEVADIIDILSTAYEEILKITGTNPDAYRDYGFSRLIPNTIADLARCAIRLKEIYNELIELTGDTGQHICTLDTIQRHISEMARDEYKIASGFITFKNYITSLSNWLYTSLSQPLKLDYLRIQTEETKVPKSSANFFVAAGYEIRSFFASFAKDYNVIGFADDDKVGEYDGTIMMWNTTSREDALILRTMIDSAFTPETNIAVNIKYVAQGLQESVLAGVGPDVAQMASGTAVSWGLRNAVADLSRVYKEGDDIPEGKKVGDEVYEGFSQLAPKDENGNFVQAVYDPTTGKFNTSFSSAAMDAVSLNGATYSIPTVMNFEMAFYRVDVFAEYDLSIPRTWQELYEVLPALVNQHMTMGMQTSLEGYQMLLYQMGSSMYTDDYKQFNSDVTSVTAFDTLCNLFSSYSLPISYDLTRFRTGEIPIVVANWTTYNTFMGYYELRGLWSIESLIGWGTYDDAGNLLSVNRSSILNMNGIVIPRGCKDEQAVWKYIKWYTGDDAQTRLARQNLATSANTTAKYNTANLNALISQAWTDEERAAMLDQIPHLKGICYNPGDYNISRYIKFAFLAVYNSNANAVDSLYNYVVDINKELTRKRKEYHLPYAGEETAEA